ncbi:MAG: YjzD family protein [Carnobacterium jeotgali]|uniref:YjzD family protein n=1 Tax=Carnobacterium jeotgali TaxID=545534 RepID=UPI0004936697|nr:YjzD family protein [Carnobacterium jeotgali]
MKYLVTLFWGFFIGQAVNYIGSSLSGSSYDFITASGIGLFIGVMVILIAKTFPDQKHEHATK